MSALSAYLAKNYLNASGLSQSSSDPSSERPKKRRKKDKSAGEERTALLIADDDDLLLSGSISRRTATGEEDNDGGPMMYDNDGRFKSAEFRKKKGSTWNTIQDPNGPSHPNKSRATDTETSPTAARRATDGEAAKEGDEADAILASAARDQDERQREIEMEDAPTVVPISATDDTADKAGNKPRMESGVRAGLQTAAETERLAAEEERSRRAEEKAAARKSKRDGSTKDHQHQQQQLEEETTIYRDATGRRIDVSMKRAEARAKEVEKLAEEKRRREEAMGDVQRRAKEERKVELEEAKFLTLGRGVEDEEMNDRLKEVQRWDDPMAAYMARKQAGDGGGGSKGKVGGGGGGGGTAGPGSGAVQRRKVYQGHAAPNRYGILPGWRWDGVDRGNGFEKDWFQARSRRSRNEELAYQWQMDE